MLGSVRLKKPLVQISPYFLCVLPVTVVFTVWWHPDTLCTSDFLNDVMFSHDGPCVMSCVGLFLIVIFPSMFFRLRI